MPFAWRIVRAARAHSAGIVRSHNAAFSDWPIPLFPARVERQTNRILSAQESPTTLECRTADVRNDANRRRLGPPWKFRRAWSAERAKHKRDQLLVKSQALRFQKGQNQRADRISLRYAPAE